MSISFVGAQGNAGTTVTIPAHEAGDLILLLAFKDGSAAPITTPAAGGTVPSWVSIAFVGQNFYSYNFRFAIATASNTTSGTWTSATEVLCLIYRGTKAIGSRGSANGINNVIIYPARTLNRANGTSWVVGVAGHRNANNVEKAPTGMTNRVATGTEIAGHDTNGPVSSWISRSVTVSHSLGWRSTTVELRDASLVLDGDTGNYSLTGQNATLTKGITLNNYTLLGDVGNFTLAGNAVNLIRNYHIAATTGTFSFIGNAATLAKSTLEAIEPDNGQFALAGNDATLRKNYLLNVSTGTFAATGRQATLRHDSKAEADTGTFALTGGTPALLLGRFLSGGSGTFIETGQPVAFRRTWTISAIAGSFALTGNPAALTKISAYEIDPVVGSFALNGQPAQLAHSQNLPVDAGIFTFSGNDAAFARSGNIDALSAQFIISGNNINLARALLLDAGTSSIVLNGLDVALEQNAALILSAGAAAFSLVGSNATLVKSGSRRRIVFIF